MKLSRLTVLLVMVLVRESFAQSDDTSASSAAMREEIRALQERVDVLERQSREPAPHTESIAGNLKENVLLGGEGAVAFFDSGNGGKFPNQEFRVDEARLSIDVRLLESAFLYTELNLMEREDRDTDAKIGELYIEAEDLLRPWGVTAPLTLRFGRFYIPFGEEYLYRNAIDNPLISHSLGDLWGVDEGIELFGSWRQFDYIVAVQNGGYEKAKDGDPDKAVTIRLGWNPDARTRVSVSAMRTGDLDVQQDESAEMWFANEYIRPEGNPEATATFEANIGELNLRRAWDWGHLAAAGGVIAYDDDDTAADNAADAYYYFVEGSRTLSGKLYGAARYSAIHSDDGFPVTGQGDYEPDVAAALTEKIWRLSLALGYRWSDQLVTKVEYSFERGERISGYQLDKQDQLAVQAAYQF